MPCSLDSSPRDHKRFELVGIAEHDCCQPTGEARQDIGKPRHGELPCFVDVYHIGRGSKRHQLGARIVAGREQDVGVLEDPYDVDVAQAFEFLLRLS